MSFRRSLKKIFGQNTHFEMDAAPDTRGLTLAKRPVATYAIGDIHGCATLYHQLVEKIVEDAKQFDGAKLLILMGDVIDRGMQSAQMIDTILSPAPAGFQRIVIRGNHEIMMRQFYTDPVSNRSWLDHGGTETLQSYGMPLDPKRGYDISQKQLRSYLTTYIPDDHLDFLETMPDYVCLPGLTFVHADVDPKREMVDQTRQTLCWKRPSPDDPAPIFGGRVVHGHTPVETATEDGWRIGIDTGAYYSGCLTAARFCDDESVRFFTT